jgi:hydrogenase maturation protease
VPHPSRGFSRKKCEKGGIVILLIEIGYESGHDFSRADRMAKYVLDFSPCGFSPDRFSLMTQPPTRCLILACGNTLRSDDGVGPHLAAWAKQRYREDPTIRVISRHQWTPDLSEDLAHAECALFLDCSIDAPPGSIQLRDVHPTPPAAGQSAQALATHYLGAPELLALALELYGSVPRSAKLFTVGAASLELGESFSPEVTAAIPEACRQMSDIVLSLVSSSQGTIPSPTVSKRE